MGDAVKIKYFITVRGLCNREVGAIGNSHGQYS